MSFLIWSTVEPSKKSFWQYLFREHKSCALGSPRVVKHHLLEFLSPISLHHGVNFLAAIAVAWQERKEQLTPVARKVSTHIDSDRVLLH
jgi:hypothetical protein